jgi:hypothetical protein
VVGAGEPAAFAVQDLETMKGAALFLFIFVLIAPQSRAFLSGVFSQSAESMNAWAPYSYVFLAMLVAGLVGSIVMVKTWPARVEPENPMSKYKKEAPSEE